ncbi:RNA polymerase sigma-28 factor [Eubacterium plexicaudatum ASF492]|uniref:RNA polymerase sigma factor n=1 Tax=Eubacterium plexicaudatum ASF492 TaxID=1235802 RepID=N2BKK8_9FIRM|nr:RNA polymerase sigma-28 factor [Eubacterium plexicaudatum ASF492]
MKTFLPPLGIQEERKVLEEMQGGSLEARNTLIVHNMRLVAHIVKKYQNADEDTEEMISIGTIGLIKAVMTFQPEKGSRLSTYAARCIDNELLMHLRNLRKVSREVSIYEPIGTDKEGNQINFMDIIESDEPDVVEIMDKSSKIRYLKKILPQILTERELEIIALRYGLVDDRPVTQKQIANRLGISRSYVSRIEKKALGKLREQFE